MFSKFYPTAKKAPAPPDDTFALWFYITFISYYFNFSRVAEEDDDDDIQICEAGEPVVKKAAPAPPPPAEDGVICLE